VSVNVTQSAAFAAAEPCRGAVAAGRPLARRPPLAIVTACPRGAQQQTRRTLLLRLIDATDRRTDGQPTVT